MNYSQLCCKTSKVWTFGNLFKTGLNLIVLFQKAGQKILYSQLFLTVTMCDEEEYIFLNYWL